MNENILFYWKPFLLVGCLSLLKCGSHRECKLFLGQYALLHLSQFQLISALPLVVSIVRDIGVNVLAMTVAAGVEVSLKLLLVLFHILSKLCFLNVRRIHMFDATFNI